MKKYLLAILAFSFLCAFDTDETGKVSFYQGDFKEMQAKAKSADKPYLIDFYTVWCGPCKNMDKYTFSDPKLAQYVRDNYLAYKVDGESLMGNGVEVAQKYDVRFYPTLLIMSPEGNVLKKLVGFQSSDALLQELKNYRFVPENPKAPTPVSVPDNQPAKPSGNTPSKSGNLFKIEVQKQENAGYGVQIGVYGDYANVMKEAQKLDAEYHKNVLVHTGKNAQNVTVFRLILGPFNTNDQAVAYVKSLKESEKRDGVVVDLTKLN